MGTLLPSLLLLVIGLGPSVQPVDFAQDPVQIATAMTATASDHADPDVQVPALRWVDAQQAEQAWQAVKSLATPAAQAAAIHRGGIEQLACKDLVDFRNVVAESGADFAFRDQFRGRSWARPALALVMVRALETFHREFPDAVVSVADIAQAGCGQVAYGELVRQVRDHEGEPLASSLLRRVRRVLGEPMVVETATAGDFPLERDRFRSTATPILIERRLLGADRAPGIDASLAQPQGGTPVQVRVATRRFALDAMPKQPRRAQAVVARLLKQVRAAVADAELVRHVAVRTWDPAAGVDRLAYLQHRVDRKHGRQLQIVTTRAAAGALDLDALVEIRTASWKPGKPESFAGETRWRPVRDETGAIANWQRWHMLGEAGHVSHLSGRDADISFVMQHNAGLHKVKPRQLDVDKTWRWLEIVQSTADELGTPVEQILVGPKVHAWLKRKLPKEARDTALWRQLLHIVPGHDAHHHLRLTQPTPAADAHALAELRRGDQPAGGALTTARR